MTKRQVEKRLQAARDRFAAEIESIAGDVRREVIIPACKRTGGNFISGMAYPLYNRDGHPYETWDAPVWIREIYDLLDSEVFYGDEPLGYWVESYRQE